MVINLWSVICLDKCSLGGLYLLGVTIRGTWRIALTAQLYWNQGELLSHRPQVKPSISCGICVYQNLRAEHTAWSTNKVNLTLVILLKSISKVRIQNCRHIHTCTWTHTPHKLMEVKVCVSFLPQYHWPVPGELIFVAKALTRRNKQQAHTPRGNDLWFQSKRVFLQRR